MKIIIFSLLLLVNVQLGTAQESNLNSTETSVFAYSPKTYAQDAIYLKTTFWGQRYIKNGEAMRLGFMGNKIKKEFEAYPEAALEFKKYQKNLRIGKIVGVGSAALAFVGLGIYASRTKDSTAEEEPNATETALYIGGLVGALGALSWSTTSSYNALEKAIYLRNMAICTN
ncbi:MAG: hypothetical protein ACOYOA_08200 [Saprospiraceae bacterium]